MAKGAVLRAIGWQVYGGLLSVAVAAVVLFELGWWIFFLKAPALLKRPWTLVIHASATLTLLALWHYNHASLARHRALTAAGPAADLDGAGLTLQIGVFAVKIEVAFLAMVALLGVLSGSLVRAGVFVVTATLAVLLHEIGHAWMAHRNGHVAAIRLHTFGGSTSHAGIPLTKRQNAAILLAGPALPLVVGALAYLLLRSGANLPELRRAILYDVIAATAGWSLLNLIPILPLDGGQLFYMYARLRAPHAASAVAAAVSALLAYRYDAHALLFTFVLLAAHNIGETAIGVRLAEWSARVERRWR